jgi:hypothetical protein
MLTPTLFFSDNTPENAHGFWIEPRGGKTYYNHGGNFFGFSCSLQFEPGTREALISMANSPGGKLSLEIADIVLGQVELPYEAEIGEGTAKEIAGYYIQARKLVDTILGIGDNHAEPFIVKVKDDFTVTVGTTKKGIKPEVFGELKQVAPYIFQDEDGFLFRFAQEGGKVDKIMTISCDLTKKPMAQVVFDYTLLWAVYVAAGFCCVMLIGSAIRKIKSKPAKNRLKVLRNIGAGFYLGILANVFICVDRMDHWPEYHTLIPHFAINMLAIPAFVMYVVFFFRTDKKASSRADIRLNAITGVCLLIMLISVVAFDLWR